MNFSEKYENQKKTNNFIHPNLAFKKQKRTHAALTKIHAFSLRFKFENMDGMIYKVKANVSQVAEGDRRQ